MQVVCANCLAINRVPPQRLGDRPGCGRCHRPLFSGEPVELSETDFERFVTGNELPVIVDFWAPWCGPCRVFAPTFVQAAAQLEPQVRLAKLDTEANPQAAGRHGIRSIPTLVAFRGGREQARVSGALALPQLLNWVRAAMT